MKNPLERSGLITTPEDMKGLKDWIELLSGPQKAVAYVAAGMAWNLAHKMVSEEIKKEESK